LLDRGNMVDQETGLPMTPQRLELALRSVYDTIISDGWNERTPGAFTGKGKLANRHADARFLLFKDADSWLAYSQRFGRPLSSLSAEVRSRLGNLRRDDLARSRHEPRHCADGAARPEPAGDAPLAQDGIQKEAHLPKYPGASGSTRPNRFGGSDRQSLQGADRRLRGRASQAGRTMSSASAHGKAHRSSAEASCRR
jgi:hypothetical protein